MKSLFAWRVWRKVMWPPKQLVITTVLLFIKTISHPRGQALCAAAPCLPPASPASDPPPITLPANRVKAITNKSANHRREELFFFFSVNGRKRKVRSVNQSGIFQEDWEVYGGLASESVLRMKGSQETALGSINKKSANPPDINSALPVILSSS